MDGIDDAVLADDQKGASRRAFLKMGAVGAAVFAAGTTSSLIVPELRRRGLWTPDGVFDAASIAWANAIYTEAWTTSPLILTPFKDSLPIPKALAPVPKAEWSAWPNPPGPGPGQQSSL
ncbi:MAG TPA: twin-arginine translocation signal domain-containing protein, partial [Ilumatobacteraceae bacterium]|nr:twin-arginine translocation signal domain-containing protein [Ilumatobacteraceae bacterium]